MKTYIVLLRGINVSGKNKIPMQELRDLLEGIGYENVRTYIQSGNIILNSEEDKTIISKKISEAIQKHFGYEVPALTYSLEDWKHIIQDNPYSEGEKAIYFTFMDQEPENTAIEVNGTKDDEFTIYKNMVYLNCLGGYGKSKLSNNLFENKLKVIATTRNFRTVHKLLELAR
ncbi:DUF1697 domain-containing protein [Pseudotenacibaculum haliotis]|uniref:DUF1697 domain-containing protein n=1 Tax=Pseudotenacibaculum haliotis TaxID=1862138 RepID=A0ABW5LQ01_9FLAO